MDLEKVSLLFHFRHDNCNPFLYSQMKRKRFIVEMRVIPWLNSYPCVALSLAVMCM